MCVVCPAGSYSVAPDSPACFDCAPGFFCPPGTPAQIPCAAGSYAEQPRAAECQLCAAGRSSAVAGASLRSQCEACVAGRYSDASGSAACAPCPQGTSTSGAEGAVGCAPCARGYASAGGLGSCSACEKGAFAANEGAARCDLCPPGRFAGDGKSAACALCPAGRFQAGVGAAAESNCTPCTAVDARLFSLALGATSAAACAPCPAMGGNLTYNVRGEGCAPCLPGYFCDGTPTLFRCFGKQENCLGQAGCAPAFAGRRCMDCSAGYFSESSQLAWESGDPNATDVVKACKACPFNSTAWLLPVFVLVLLIVPVGLVAFLCNVKLDSRHPSLLVRLWKAANHINSRHGTFVSILVLHVKFLNQLFASSMLTWPGEFKRLLELMNGIPREGCLLSSGYTFFFGWELRGVMILYGLLFVVADIVSLPKPSSALPQPSEIPGRAQPDVEPQSPGADLGKCGSLWRRYATNVHEYHHGLFSSTVFQFSAGMFFTFCVKAMPCMTLSTGETVMFADTNTACSWSPRVRWLSVVFMVVYSILFAWYYICPLFSYPEWCRLHRPKEEKQACSDPEKQEKLDQAVRAYNFVRRTLDFASSLALLSKEGGTVSALLLFFRIADALILFLIQSLFFRSNGWLGLYNYTEVALLVASVAINIATVAISVSLAKGLNLYSSGWGWGTSAFPPQRTLLAISYLSPLPPLHAHHFPTCSSCDIACLLLHWVGPALLFLHLLWSQIESRYVGGEQWMLVHPSATPCPRTPAPCPCPGPSPKPFTPLKTLLWLNRTTVPAIPRAHP